MTRTDSARRRFLAALGLYLIWVGVLAAMAVTSADRPPATLVPQSAGETPAADRTPGQP